MQVIQSATPPAYINAAAPENTALAGTILVITADAARIHPQLAHIFLDRWRVRRPYRRRWGWCWGHHANAEKGLKFCCKLLGGFCDRRSGSRSRRSSRSTNAKQFLESPGKHLHLLCRTPCFCTTGACMTTPAATGGTSRRRLHCRNVGNVGRMRKKGGRPGAQVPLCCRTPFNFFRRRCDVQTSLCTEYRDPVSETPCLPNALHSHRRCCQYAGQVRQQEYALLQYRVCSRNLHNSR